MKAEINNENKAKFFAQYWGQRVMKETIFPKSPICIVNTTFINDAIVYHLELTPLSMISDEDAIEVAKLINWGKSIIKEKGNEPHIRTQAIDFGKNAVLDILKPLGRTYITIDHFDMINCYDMLRSKGYALPWMGLSVDEMAESGWIKLTEK